MLRTMTISSCSSSKIAFEITSDSLSSYPLVIHRRAFAYLSGVRLSPSRSGSSPKHSSIVLTAALSLAVVCAVWSAVECILVRDPFAGHPNPFTSATGVLVPLFELTCLSRRLWHRSSVSEPSSSCNMCILDDIVAASRRSTASSKLDLLSSTNSLRSFVLLRGALGVEEHDFAVKLSFTLAAFCDCEYASVSAAPGPGSLPQSRPANVPSVCKGCEEEEEGPAKDSTSRFAFPKADEK